MAKIIPITEHYQHFLAEMKESFWGDVYGETKLAWKRLLEADSERRRDRYAVREVYQRRSHRRQPYRNGYYERDFVTRLGTIRLRIARTRGKSFLPRALEPFQRRAEDVAMLIREAFLRGISTRQVGRVVAQFEFPKATLPRSRVVHIVVLGLRVRAAGSGRLGDELAGC